MDYSALFDALVDAVIVIDAKGQIVRVNPGCLQLFGYDSAALVGENVRMLMAAETAVEHDGFIQSYLSGNPAQIIGIGREVTARHASGQMFPVRLSVAAMSHEGAPHFVGILHDLTKQYEAEATASAAMLKLQQMNRSITVAELGSALAHELNQPLTALLLYLSAAQKYLSDNDLDATIHSLFDKAMGEGKRAADIILRIRSMIEDREVERHSVSVDPLLQDVTRFMRLILKDRPIEVRRTPLTPSPMILADPVQLSQVLINVLKNAGEAIDARPGIIEVSAALDDGEVTVTLEDSGPGFDDEVLPTLFTSFQTTKATGLGIGLSLSRRFIEQMGGRIWADNKSRLGGARVQLSFPLSKGI